MDLVVGIEDTSYKPSEEGKLGRGRMTRCGIGKGWGIPPAEGKGTFHRAKRAHYPLKYPGCLVATSPDAMEVRERPSRTLRNL